MSQLHVSRHLVEQLLVCGRNRVSLPAELESWLRRQLKDGQIAALQAALRQVVVPQLDYTAASTLSRILAKMRKAGSKSGAPLKIAFLCSFTTNPFVSFADLFLRAANINAEIYTADFGTFRQEIIDADSALYAFRPEIVVMEMTWRDLAHRPGLTDRREASAQKVDAEVRDWASLWKMLNDRLGCAVVQSNFAPPAFRSLGNHEARHESGFARFVSRVNLAIVDSAPSYVTIHDLDHLCAIWGRWAWDDSRYFHQAKLPCSPEMLVDYAYDLSGIILSLRGQARKCLVLDLDNTLWGGVIGDDGLVGIRLGQGDPEGEAFIAFQKYAKALKERGVILAVCSKNTESVAREVFEKHEEMVLRLDDISCFMANWEDKAGNIKRIAEQLNIGMNSLVFVDDNPAERAIVREVCPDVAVPEMPKDPAEYVEVLDRYRYFQTTTISAEDLQRTSFYRASGEREALEASATDMDSFLISLELRAKVVPISAANLERSAQLIGRSNQFNLTTRRYSTADLLAMMKKPDWVTRTISLKDRFGDNGLISVVLANVEEGAMRIDTWLMSCRVLKRGVERLQLDDLAEIARARGLSKIVGEYIPTTKNALVVAHYKSLGFEQIDDGPDGRTRWQLDVGPNWQPLPHHIILEQV